jgi:uncharacterized protein GlcG (DUF336 family)
MRYLNPPLSLFVVLVLLAGQAIAQNAGAPAASPPYGMPISVDQARAAADAAVAEAKKNNWIYAVAVVEPSGALVYFERMDDAQYASTQIAMDRARTSALFRRTTKSFADRVAQQNDLSVLSLAGSNWSEGGVPIIVGGKLIGAIGASGGTQPQDGQVAKAGADAVR